MRLRENVAQLALVSGLMSLAFFRSGLRLAQMAVWVASERLITINVDPQLSSLQIKQKVEEDGDTKVEEVSVQATVEIVEQTED